MEELGEDELENEYEHEFGVDPNAGKEPFGEKEMLEDFAPRVVAYANARALADFGEVDA